MENMRTFVTSLLKRLRSPFSKKKNKSGDKSRPDAVDFRDIGQREADVKKLSLVASLDENLRLIKDTMGNSYDLSIRYSLAGPEKVPCAFIYIDGLVDKIIREELLRVVNIDTIKTGIKELHRGEIYETVKNRLLTGEVREAEDLHTLFDALSLGDTALIFDGTAKAIIFQTRGWETRNIEEPAAEVTIRGQREGFVENIRTNTSLIRRRIRTPNLWIENMILGKLTRTEVAFAYIKGLAGEEVLGELRSRLGRIDTDSILESGKIEELIRDCAFSPFPTIFRTERPDRVAAALLEGRVAIFTNGTPFVLILPADFIIFMQAPDDYNELWPIGNLVRILRLFSFLLAIFLPGIYVSVLNYHQELLPTPLLLTIQSTREGIPFPVVVEILLMDVTFEILREAGVRLPRAIGTAISIVGALILGDAAIRAGLVSPGVVIIVAFTAIASFTNPVFSMAITGRMLRFIIIILGAAFGLLGVQLGLLLLLVHLVSVRSFGYPYFAPFGPFIKQDLKDAVIRDFWWNMTRRPKLLGFREPGRQPPGQMPRPPREDDKSNEDKKGGEGS
jgi:spore germination protein KA